jgi:hypothetical protein
MDSFLILCLMINSSRFCQIPTFGKGTIRQFSNNVSQMQKLAARDFEDILQVSNIDLTIPTTTVIKKFPPEHDPHF